MTKLLDQLKKEFDLVILDGPPLFVEDSQILSLKVGGVILVVRLGGTITDDARAMLDQLELMGAHVLGAALNRVPHGDTYYFSGSYSIVDKKPDKPLEKVSAGQS
jgi:receptor protein-tyrosine kinase